MAQKKKLATVESVLALLFFILFLVMTWMNLFVFRFIHWYSLIIFILPAAAFATLYLYRQKHNDINLKIWNICLGIVMTVVTVINFTLMVSGDEMLPSRSVMAYERIMKAHGYPSSKGVAFFPAKVPKDAKDVRFYDEPAWIDGPTIMLRYDISNTEVEAVRTKYEPIATKVLKASDVSIVSDDQPAGISFAVEEFSIIGYTQLPADFELILLNYSTIEQEASSDKFYSYGIAVSKQRNEVIYFYRN